MLVSWNHALRVFYGKNLRRSKLLDTLASEPLTHVNAVVKRLARDNTGAEATSEGITVE
jgi:hypothetical protein